MKENIKVAIIKSDVKRAEDIKEDQIKDMVRKVVKLAGGLDFIKDGQFVVIKPNLLGTREYSGNIGAVAQIMSNPYTPKKQVPSQVNGITVDWRVTKALVELVREQNPSGKLYIMECSGEGDTEKNYKRLGYTKENMPGVDRFVGFDKLGGKYKDVTHKDFVAIDLKDKQRYKKLPRFLENKYYVDKTYYSSDVIISVACLKNHMYAAVTGGIKNIAFGITPPRLYGMSKDKIIRAIKIDHRWVPINQFIHDNYIIKPVHFVLTDGLQGLAYGPQAQVAPSYEEAKMNMRVMLASKDPVAIDTVHACIVGVDPEKVDYLRYISESTGGVRDTSKISVVGNVQVSDIKKQFPIGSGVMGTVYREVPKTLYKDYIPPQVNVETAKVEGDKLTMTLVLDAKVNKVELYKGESLLACFRENLSHICYQIEQELQLRDMYIVASDRLLNSSKVELRV